MIPEQLSKEPRPVLNAFFAARVMQRVDAGSLSKARWIMGTYWALACVALGLLGGAGVSMALAVCILAPFTLLGRPAQRRYARLLGLG